MVDCRVVNLVKLVVMREKVHVWGGGVAAGNAVNIIITKLQVTAHHINHSNGLFATGVGSESGC